MIYTDSVVPLEFVIYIYVKIFLFSFALRRMESAYRTWVRERRAMLLPEDLDKLCWELQTALGTAKWQVHYFSCFYNLCIPLLLICLFLDDKASLFNLISVKSLFSKIGLCFHGFRHHQVVIFNIPNFHLVS